MSIQPEGLEISYLGPPQVRVGELASFYGRASRISYRSSEHARRWATRTWRQFREDLYQALKRCFDIFSATLLLVLLSPLLGLIALAIKLTDGGPVLFWQRRVGAWGTTFDCPKFRSMVVNADQMIHVVKNQNHHGESITFKIKRDPRVTPIGRLIRRFSFDEFPQLWCVLMGTMSMVGPRPALPREVDLYELAHRRRLRVLPGMTCIWQVSGRADIPFERQVEMDIEYIENRSLWLDLKIVLSTVPAVITGRGAY
jgi:lipopolysaccharide/colanic/teichoic acid biosynthesis glycosyltransferase